MLLQKCNTKPFQVMGPVQGRLGSLDVLRGFALLGVFITHFICEFYGLAFDVSPIEPAIATPIDSFAEKLLRLVFFDKARGMFSFLFGVGFYFQLVKAGKTGVNFRIHFIKRLAILLIFGLIHYYFLFKGDVLRFYAVLGVLLLLCYKMRPKLLLIASILLAVVVPATCTLFKNDLFIAGYNTPATIAIFGHFLFGFWVAQKNIFSDLFLHRVSIKKVFTYTLVLNFFLYGIRAIARLGEASGLFVMAPFSHDLLHITFMVGIQAMILTIISGVLLLYMQAAWKKRLSFLVAPGQMTLTNYIMQSVLGVLIFQIGLYEQLGTLAAFLVSVALCLVQIYYSNWWLSRFKSGPLEMLWRKLTSIQLERQETITPKPEPINQSKRAKEISFAGMTLVQENA